MAQTGQALEAPLSTDTPTSHKSETSSPMSRVLGTYELLEHILLHLPLKNLYVTQRVSATWRDLLKCSKRIQEKMLIAAAQEPHCPTSKAVKDKPIARYPTINELRLNPLLHTHYGLHNNYSEPPDDAVAHADLFLCSNDQQGDQLAIFVLLFNDDNQPIQPAVQDVLFCQPPITTMFCVITETDPDYMLLNDENHSERSTTKEFHNPQGLRFRDLMLSSRTHYEEFSFWVTSEALRKGRKGRSGWPCERC